MYYIHIRTYMHIKFHVHTYTTRPFQASSASRDESTMNSTNPTCRRRFGISATLGMEVTFSCLRGNSQLSMRTCWTIIDSWSNTT